MTVSNRLLKYPEVSFFIHKIGIFITFFNNNRLKTTLETFKIIFISYIAVNIIPETITHLLINSLVIIIYMPFYNIISTLEVVRYSYLTSLES
jgi:hypothetical protein